MNRRFYLYGILFTVLSLITGLFYGVAYVLLHEGIYFLESFADWLVVTNIIALTGAIILLLYYFHKKYWWAFSAGIMYTGASLCYFAVFYHMLITREQGRSLNATYLAIFGTAVLYAVSLIFSNARERAWLKAAGVFILITGLVLVTTFTWINQSHDRQTQVALTGVFQWTSIAANLLFVFFLKNYAGELKGLKLENVTTSRNEPTTLRQEPTTSRQELFNFLAILTGAIALGATLILGSKLTGEGLDKAGYTNKVTDHARKLAEPFEARTYTTHSGYVVRYRFMKPVNYDPQKKYPLVVCLHHGGAHGTDNIIQIDGSGAAQLLSTPANRIKYPAFLFAPQCPTMSNWAAIDQSVFETIRSLETAFAVDTARIYVTGVSGGGYGSWDFICVRPKMFAAAIPVCGAGDTALARNVIDLPVWDFQGEDDRFVPARLPRAMIAAISKAGGHPLYTEFPGEGHNIWDRVSQTPGLLDWLFAQKRE